MKLDAKMVNLLGLLALVVVLGLGALGIVMPAYDKVQDTQVQLDQERDTNNNFQLKLIALADAETRQTEIEGHVASLRKTLPGGAESEAVIHAIADALESSGVMLQSYTYGEAMMFAPRGTDPVEGGEAADDSDGTGVNQLEGLTAEDLEDLPPELIAELDGTAKQNAAPSQQQSEISLSLAAVDHAQATAFLDALHAADRAMLVTSAVLVESEIDGFGYSLEVSLMTYFYDRGVGVDEE